MTDVPSNLIPTRITQLPEYAGSSQEGFFPYVFQGVTYKVQFSNVASAGEVPPTRTLTAGTGLVGGGDLSSDRVFAIADAGVGADQLNETGVSAGTYGSASSVPIVTIDANGRVTSATSTSIIATGYVPETRTVTAGDGLTGGGVLSSNLTLSANLSSQTPQALGTATAGASTAVAREDHVHPAVDLSDTDQTQGALPLGRGGTGDALSPVAGAVVYSTGTKFAVTNPGLAGQVLISNGTDEPQWQTLSGVGTVTSVAASGGTTGLTFDGSPITVSGTLTLGGTLGVANGGTGLTDAPEEGELLIGNGTGYDLATLTAGTGVAVTNAAGSITLVNTAPDQVVSLTGAGDTEVTGTYPNFTITSTSGGGGTVTSVDASGGTTGLTFSGGPITNSGTITLGGTLGVANGGTGATTSTGNGSVVLADSPTLATPTLDTPILVSPTLGEAAATLIANAAGTEGAPSYTFTGDLDTGVWSPSANTIAVSTDGTERIRFDEDGNIGINGLPELPISGNTVRTKFAINADGTQPVIGLTHANDAMASSGTILYTSRSRGTLAAPAGVQDNDTLCTLAATGHDGTDFAVAARIDFAVDGVPGSNVMPGRITFSVSPDGSQITTERMRIASDGNVGIGTTDPQSKLHVGGALTLDTALAVANGGTNGNATPTAGAVAYGDGGAYAFTNAGTTGQVLLSNGSSAPSFGGIDGGTF